MGLETAQYINSLDETYPTGLDSRTTADDHLRLIKASLKRTFPSITSAIGVTDTQLNYVMGLSSSAQDQINALITGKMYNSATAAFAISANWAGSANYALSAGAASDATLAARAISADNAGSAVYAYSATNATSAVSAYSTKYNGVEAIIPISTGINVYSPTDNNPLLQLVQDDQVTTNAVIQAHGTTGLAIANYVNGAPIGIYGDDAGGTQRLILNADPDTGVELYYNSVNALKTAPIAANGTGASVTDGAGAYRPIGMNVTPAVQCTPGTHDLRIANMGMNLYGYAGAGVIIDIDATTDTAPSGAVWIVSNFQTTHSLSITASGPTTLYWFDGIGVGPLTGTRTLAPYGYCTITFYGGAYGIVGVGLS